MQAKLPAQIQNPPRQKQQQPLKQQHQDQQQQDQQQQQQQQPSSLGGVGVQEGGEGGDRPGKKPRNRGGRNKGGKVEGGEAGAAVDTEAPAVTAQLQTNTGE